MRRLLALALLLSACVPGAVPDPTPDPTTEPVVCTTCPVPDPLAVSPDQLVFGDQDGSLTSDPSFAVNPTSGQLTVAGPLQAHALTLQEASTDPSTPALQVKAAVPRTGPLVRLQTIPQLQGAALEVVNQNGSELLSLTADGGARVQYIDMAIGAAPPVPAAGHVRYYACPQSLNGCVIHDDGTVTPL